MADFTALPRHYSLRECAEYLGVSTATVRRLIAVGKLRGKRVGVQLRVLAEELERFMREDECKTGQDAISSSPEGNAEPSTFAGTKEDRQRALALAHQIASGRKGCSTSITSEAKTRLRA